MKHSIKERFNQKWKQRWRKKLRTAFLGAIFWGIAFAILNALWESDFTISKIPVHKLFGQMIQGYITGFIVILFGIEINPNRLTGFDCVKEGVKKLMDNEIWNYNNLIIFKDSDGIVTVRKDIYWLYNEEKTSEKLDKSFNRFLKDFMALKDENVFTDYIKGKQIKFQLFETIYKL